MKNIFATAVLLCCAFFATAQNARLKGSVKNQEGEALEMANVIALIAKDSSMAAFAFSNPKGEFELRVPANENYILRISYLGYASKDAPVSISENQKESFTAIVLDKASEDLNEIVLSEEMPIVISGDTVSYKADAFNSGNEKKLEDVLENLPGFETDDDGQIKIEGKTVEKIMVEGKEFFDGDTKVATKNIPADAIDKIQVLRNYNDVSPLGGVTNNEDRVAINIVLKEGKKSMLFGDVEAAGGLDDRYLGHANIFKYSPKTSINFIGDMNNIGQPAFTFRDYFRFTGGMKSLSSKSGSNLNIASDLGIPLGADNRNTQNSSQFAAGNFNFNPNKAWSVNGFLMFSRNDVGTQSENLNTYIGQDTLDQTEVLTSTGSSLSTSALGKLSVQYAPSTKTHIAYDLFGRYAETNSSDYQNSFFALINKDITSTNSQKPIEFKQNFEAIFDLDSKNIISFEAQHQYKKQDPLFDLLTNVQPNFEILPIVDTNNYNLLQSKVITTNTLNAALNYYYVINSKNHLEFAAGGSYNKQNLTSGIAQLMGDETINFTDRTLNNDVDFRLTDAFVGMHYRTIFGKLTVKPGFNIHQYQTKVQQLGDEQSKNYTFILPDFFAKYAFKSSSALTFNYGMKASFTDVSNAAQGVLLQSYNSLFMGNPDLDNALYHSLSLRYNSYNMFNFTSIYAGATYNYRMNDITQTVNYFGIDRINTPINAQSANQVASAFGGYQRRFGYYKAGAGVNLSYSTSNNLVNNVENLNESYNQSYNVSFGTNFKKLPNIDVGYKVSLNNYSGGNVKNVFVNHAPYVKLEASFLKDFVFEGKYTYNNYTSQTTNNSSIYDFLEAGLYYTTPSEKWEFSLTGTNLLDTEFIRQDSFSNSVTSTSVTYVLPRFVLLGAKYRL